MSTPRSNRKNGKAKTQQNLSRVLLFKIQCFSKLVKMKTLLCKHPRLYISVENNLAPISNVITQYGHGKTERNFSEYWPISLSYNSYKFQKPNSNIFSHFACLTIALKIKTFWEKIIFVWLILIIHS